MGELRGLTHADGGEIRRVLALRPLTNIHVASRVEKFGVDGIGNPLLGWYEGRHLLSMYSDGHTLQPVSACQEATDAFARRAGHRKATSITGARDETVALWKRLCEESFPQWASPREVRDCQYIMKLDGPAHIVADPRVTALGTRYLDPYFEAARAMYAEEVGIAPYDVQAYRGHVAGLMMRGMTYGLLDNDRVAFKVDVVADASGVAQIGGVWLRPEFRGRGLSAPLLAGVANDLLTRWNTVTLYVNNYNTPAIASYTRIGFSTVDECATVLY
ncbi:MAG: GNAT family N-acetyltransferase [Propionibacteriaceae bacterium]|jgi:ribosomal protein S18 acetylase RimI-like enzyme|nr:GNAT family N-acetyltransferase [Propionibacteriaceae bacterium]